MPKISVIVPVYNTEKYLHRCVDSILAQAFTDFELLLIDDGSTDSSGAICDEYAQADPRVRVFHIENGGASTARNLGLDNALGDWITFVDSDDWIGSNMYKDMITKAYEDKSEMVVCGVVIENNKIEKVQLQCPIEYVSNKSLQNISLIEGAICSSLWNKLFRRDLFIENNIKSEPRLSMWDDLWIVLRIRFFCPKISIVNNAYYHYRITDSPSITKSNVSSKISSQLLCASLLSDFFREKNVIQQYVVLSNWLKFHAKDALFDEGAYDEWRKQVPETHSYVWQYRSYYGLLRVLRYFIVIYGGNLGCCFLKLYKDIKGKIDKLKRKAFNNNFIRNRR